LVFFADYYAQNGNRQFLGVMVFLIFKENSSASANTNTEVSYNLDKYNHDFSSITEKSINLNDITNKLSITTGGVYHLTGTLNGYVEINTTEYVKIILDNATINNSNGPAIYVESSKGTYINLVGNSTLSDSSTYTGFSTDVTGCIYSKDDLIIDGDGTLNVKANYEDGIVSKDDLVIKSGNINITSKDDGIRGKDTVILLDGNYTINAGGDGIKSTNDKDSTKGSILIKNGTYKITSTLDAIEAITKLEIDDGTFDITTGGGSSTIIYTTDPSAKGLKSDNSIVINKINLAANTKDDAIHSNNIVEINDGTLNISTGDDGIHADSLLTINAGTININKSYEGLESQKITINGGDIKVASSDDGINIYGGDSQNMGPGGNTNATVNTDLMLTINGGNIYVNAGGDGLDSNGSIIMNGGYVTVDGPIDNGNGAIDYNNTFEINGGTLIAAGSSGMAQNVSGGTQGSVIIYFSTTEAANTTVSIDGVGSYTSSKNFSSIVISSPKLTVGTTYTIKVNDTNYTTFTMSDTITKVGNTSNNFGGPRR
jgi:hypothetical protein